MKARVERVQAVRSDTEILLTLTVLACAPRTHTYRVTKEGYLQAGSPEEGDTLDEGALALLIGEEDARLAYSRAVKILASGDNTKKALLRKLCERGFLRESAMDAVEKLARDGYIREQELLLRQLGIYAKRLWGPKKFMPALLEKGFERDLIQNALVRAKDEGIYDPDAVKKALLDALPTDDAVQRRAWLYKHGF